MRGNDPILSAFLRLSDAAYRLAQGMWGGLRQADPVRAVKRCEKKLSVGFGPWQERAKRRIRTAAVAGELTVYVLTESKFGIDAPAPVPASILERLITSRGGLPDHCVRMSVQKANGDVELARLLTNGLLVVRKFDFDKWYRSERAKGKWPSQKSRLKKPRGRPRKQSAELHNAILRQMRDGAWRATDGIPALRRILVQTGLVEVPSVNTLRSMVSEMLAETGDAELRVTPKKSRRPAKSKNSI
jgi:hypothetical protein